MATEPHVYATPISGGATILCCCSLYLYYSAWPIARDGMCMLHILSRFYLNLEARRTCSWGSQIPMTTMTTQTLAFLVCSLAPHSLQTRRAPMHPPTRALVVTRALLLATTMALWTRSLTPMARSPTSLASSQVSYDVHCVATPHSAVC
jgi:hypothetical protein